MIWSGRAEVLHRSQSANPEASVHGLVSAASCSSVHRSDSWLIDLQAGSATGDATEELTLQTPDEPVERKSSAVLSLQTSDAAQEEWLVRFHLAPGYGGVAAAAKLMVVLTSNSVQASRDRAARKPPSRAPSGQLEPEEDDIKAQLAQVIRENERLKVALDNCSSQHEWALSSVLKSAEAEKYDFAVRLQCVLVLLFLNFVTKPACVSGQ